MFSNWSYSADTISYTNSMANITESIYCWNSDVTNDDPLYCFIFTAKMPKAAIFRLPMVLMSTNGTNGKFIIGINVKTPIRHFCLDRWFTFPWFSLKERALKHNPSRIMTKPTKWHVRPAKTQISLGFRPVWSESLLYTQWVATDPSFLHADSEDWSVWVDAHADLSLRWAHTHFVGFVISWLNLTINKSYWQLKILTLAKCAPPFRIFNEVS